MAPNKRKRTINDEQRKPKCSREVNQNKKLSDLNEDVLIEIFLYLNEEDLLNVVNASKVFSSICHRTVKQKYKNAFFKLPLDTTRYKCMTNTNYAVELSIEFLRCFGKDISKIKLNYRLFDSEKCNSIIHDMVLETCHESLTEIEFINLSIDLKINKCFTKLKTLRIASGNVDNSVCQFSRWFPKVEKLYINCVNNIATKLNARRGISSLKRFSLCSCSWSGKIFKLNQFISSNPQLKVLGVNEDQSIYDHIEYHTMNKSDSLKGAVSPVQMMTVKLGMISQESIRHLATDRIEHLELKNSISSDACALIAKCLNLKTLKLFFGFTGSSLCRLFEKDPWKSAANHRLLTQLELVFDIYEDTDVLKIGLMAIVPYLKECKNLCAISDSILRELTMFWWIPMDQY